MSAMTKIVNIRTRVAVRTVTPPICGTVKGIVMTTGDILKCLCKRAQVEEVLPDGTTVKLNMSNYYTDNGAGLDAKKNMPAPEKKPAEKIERFKVPVTPVEKTEKQVVETKTEEEKPTESVETAQTEAPVEVAFATGTSIVEDTESAPAEGVYAGGIVGTLTTASDVNIENCSNSGSVSTNRNSGKKNKKK